MKRFKVRMEGKRFGQLVVLRRVRNRYYISAKRRHSEHWYQVKCDCGKTVNKRGYMLRLGRTTHCGHVPRAFKHGLSFTREYRMWKSAKERAEELGIKFTLKPNDIVIPKLCPLLGIKISNHNRKVNFNSPSVDRKNPKKGYIKENIWVVSHKANTIKSNASLRELQTLVRNLEKSR